MRLCASLMSAVRRAASRASADSTQLTSGLQGVSGGAGGPEEGAGSGEDGRVRGFAMPVSLLESQGREWRQAVRLLRFSARDFLAAVISLTLYYPHAGL